MTQYETQALAWLTRIYQALSALNTFITSKLSPFLDWFQDEFSIWFFPLLIVIIAILILKWISRW